MNCDQHLSIHVFDIISWCLLWETNPLSRNLISDLLESNIRYAFRNLSLKIFKGEICPSAEGKHVMYVTFKPHLNAQNRA